MATTKDDIEKNKYCESLVETLRAQSVDIDESPYFIICVGEEIKTQIKKSQALKEVSAVKMGRVYYIDEEILDIRAPRSINALYAVAEVLGYQIDAPFTDFS